MASKLRGCIGSTLRKLWARPGRYRPVSFREQTHLAVVWIVLLGGGRALAAEAQPTATDGQAAEHLSLQLPAGGTERSGLLLATLQTEQYVPETHGIAEVVDLQPLLNLRANYFAAEADETIAKAALQASQQEYARVATLFRAGAATSRRQLQEAESRLAIDRARLAGTQQRQRSLREQGLQQWGQELLGLALQRDADLFTALLERKAVLVLASFAAEVRLPTPVRQLALTEEGGAGRTALKIWPAPVTSPVVQGESYYAAIADGTLRTGMRLPVSTPTSASPLGGLLIPAAAVVWQAGEPWAYVKLAPETYQRRPITRHTDTGRGWLVSDGFRPGEQIVVRGAQSLLSAEQGRGFSNED